MKCGNDYIEKCKNRISNIFWKDVFNACCKILRKDKLIINENYVIASPLWHNSDININGKYVFYINWYRHGIVHVNDLLNSDGSFISYQHFLQLYALNVDFSTYNGII